MTVRWGVLGAGFIAANMVGPAIHHAPGAELYAAAARDRERARALKPTGPVHASYADLLADRDVDAVYIGLHNDAHRPWAVAALEAGKHVLCEKPLGLTAAEVGEMAAAAAQADRVLVEALMYRWHPRVRMAERLVAEGRIGTVHGVAAAFTFNGVAPGNYRLESAHGGGALYDLGCYPISAALWAFGHAPVRDVTAQLDDGPSGVDMAADVRIQFDGGEAELHVGMAEPDRQSLVVTGDGGVLELPGQPYTSWRGAGTELRVGGERITVPAVDQYRVMVEDVSSAISGTPAYVVSLDETRSIAEVVDAAFAAGRS